LGAKLTCHFHDFGFCTVAELIEILSAPAPKRNFTSSMVETSTNSKRKLIALATLGHNSAWRFIAIYGHVDIQKDQFIGLHRSIDFSPAPPITHHEAAQSFTFDCAAKLLISR
jgi:hypothetical protein